MNDRSVSLLERYDIEVLRTWKGRGAILCETKQGIMIFKEYAGSKERAIWQDTVLANIAGQGFSRVESIVKNKEEELLVSDQDGISYILKTYFDGRECNVKDMEECRQAVKTLALLHKASMKIEGTSEMVLKKELEKHNKELKKVRRFLKEKSQKSDFEIYLMQTYDYFFDKALEVTAWLEENAGDKGNTGNIICHGDYQYHNLLLDSNGMSIINFEKCIEDNPLRDLYLFMRKLLEKSNWSQKIGEELLGAYDANRSLEKLDYLQLFYRLAYPEKFWKIVNFYYNSGKAWIPGRNMEKLEKVIYQERDKQIFLENYKRNYGLF